MLIFNSCSKEYSCENCRKSNKPPIANAGRDTILSLPVDFVVLNGSGSYDPDGKISKWLWRNISGSASVAIINPNDSTTKITSLVTGVYQFELKVTDNGGLVAIDTSQIVVNSPVKVNHPPIANAGVYQTITLPVNAVFLDGKGSSDPDHNNISYVWTKISGPSSFVFANSKAVETQVTNLAEGVYLFELKVADAGGLSSKDSMHVIVNKVNENPPDVTNSSCLVQNLTWTPADNGMMTLTNRDAVAGTLDCAGYGGEVLIPLNYDVWVQYEGSSEWVHLDFVFRDAINSASPNIFLSSVYYFDPNDGGLSFAAVYAKPNSGIDFMKKVSVKNNK